jgi:hypothetical protein
MMPPDDITAPRQMGILVTDPATEVTPSKVRRSASDGSFGALVPFTPSTASASAPTPSSVLAEKGSRDFDDDELDEVCHIIESKE